MYFILESFFLPLVAFSLIATLICVIYLKYHAFQYWSKRKIPFVRPTIPAGNIGNALIGKQSLGDVVKDIYNEFKDKGYKHAGLYVVNSPVYMPIDPDIIKNILVKDFQYFIDRGVFYDEINEPLTAHLFSLEGTKWKNLRAKLSPTFTSGKMKMMFDTLVECSEGLKTVCDKVSENEGYLDVKDILARFTTDVIGSCAFGLDCNSLNNPNAEFRKMGKKVMQLSTWQAAKQFLAVGFPAFARTFKLKLFDPEASYFFIKAIKHTIDHREQNHIKRRDFLQLLIQLKQKGCLDDDENGTSSPGSNLTFNEVAAQAFLFFIAGFETSATTISFTLFELACNSDIQEKAREEVQNVLKEYNGKLTYEAIMKMTYMEKIVQETLRKYPPVLLLNRQCTNNYKVPNTNLTLEKGTNVFIPVYGLHKNPKYYPNPEKFDPERFSEENKANRHSALYLPFGEGPRICIGLRFGMMQVKVGLAVLLNRYIITLNDKTKTPLTFIPNSFILTAENGIWINVKKI